MPFSDTSLSVSFATPLAGQGGGSVFVNKYKVEWDVVPSFDSVDGLPLSFNPTLTQLMSEVCVRLSCDRLCYLPYQRSVAKQCDFALSGFLCCAYSCIADSL